MKTKMYCIIMGLVSCILTSCGFSKGGADYPATYESNDDQIVGMVVSKPISYDKNLGYKLAIDENQDGMFDEKTENYAWMPNDMYYELLINDSIVIKAVRFYETHGLSDCDEYIIFEWHLAIQDSLTGKQRKEKKR